LFAARDKFEFYEKFGFEKRPTSVLEMQYKYREKQTPNHNKTYTQRRFQQFAYNISCKQGLYRGIQT
jgi:hypothetical protein